VASAGYEPCIPVSLGLWSHLQIFWNGVTGAERLALFYITTYFDRPQPSSSRPTKRPPKQLRPQQPFELRKRCVGVNRPLEMQQVLWYSRYTCIAVGRGVWHVWGTRNAYEVSVAKSESKRPPGRPWHKW
jgi:hypothetical protein